MKMIEWFHHKSMLSVPIVVRKDIVGAIVVYSKIINYYDEEDSQFLLMLGSHLGLAVENAKLMSDLKIAATLDPLTGAYNHRYFRNKLEEALNNRSNLYVSLVMLDINNFKEINDKYGHLAGDHVLQVTTQLIKNFLDNNALLARYGGDEFALVLPGISFDHANKIGFAIEHIISEFSFTYNNQNINVSISWGVITNQGRKIKNVNTLIDGADKQLYNMKKSTRNS